MVPLCEDLEDVPAAASDSPSFHPRRCDSDLDKFWNH